MQFWADDTKLVGILIGLFNTDKSGASDAVIGNAGLLIEDLVTSGRKEAIEMQEFSTPSPFLLQLTRFVALLRLSDHLPACLSACLHPTPLRQPW